jgi:hypothetical protein
VVPLVARLVALSAWPDAISGHSFGTSSKQTAAYTAPAERR